MSTKNRPPQKREARGAVFNAPRKSCDLPMETPDFAASYRVPKKNSLTLHSRDTTLGNHHKSVAKPHNC